jgi:RNA polymerase primary sigma factor
MPPPAASDKKGAAAARGAAAGKAPVNGTASPAAKVAAPVNGVERAPSAPAPALARRQRVRAPRVPAAVSMRDPFQHYMEEISRGDVLDHATVIALAATIKEGARVEEAQRSLVFARPDRRPTLAELAEYLGNEPEDVQLALNKGMVAKNDLVAANLRLVTSVARKIQGSKTGTAGLALDDMIQEGNVGLIRAAEKYDASRGYRFSTYATWWVRASVLRAITTQSRPIKVPSTVVEDFSRIEKERARQIAAGARDADDDLCAQALGITTAKLRFVCSVVSRVTASLDVSITSPGGLDTSGMRTLGELIPGDDDMKERMVEEMQRVELDKVLRGALKPMERAAVRLRYGLDDGHPRTLREVGLLLSVSKERVRQLVYAALSKLKTPEIRECLADVLEGSK